MSRSTPAPLGLVLGSMIVASVALAVLGTGAGCSTQETSPAPDAAQPPCQTGPFLFCAPVAADAPGCNTDDGASRWLARLPRNTRYPVGCVINFVGERDEQGDCKLEGVCKCSVGEPTAPATDAGTADVGDAAAPVPAPASTDAGSPGPVFSCYP